MPAARVSFVKCRDSKLYSCPEANRTEAYQCLDPTSANYLCDHLRVEGSDGGDTICETCVEFMAWDDRTRIRDGHCDTDLNVKECQWDGGETGVGNVLVYVAIASSHLFAVPEGYPDAIREYPKVL